MLARIGGLLREGGVPLLAILAFALLARAAYLTEFFRSNPFATELVSDAKLYHDWAMRIADGDLLGKPEPYHHPPLYPYLLGLLYAIVGPHPAVMIVLQALAGVGALLAMFALARRFAGRGAALLATALVALYLPLPFYETRLLAESLTTLVAAIALLEFTALAASRGNWLRGGLALGIACALRPNELLAGLLIGAVVSLSRRADRMLALTALLAGVALPIAPFFLRNVLHAGEPVLLCDTGGVNLHLAWNAESGISFKTSDPALGDVLMQPEVARRLALQDDQRLPSFSETSSRLMARALRYVTSQPLAALRLATERLAACFQSFEYCIVYTPSAERSIQRTSDAFPLPFAVLGALLLAGIGAWFRGREQRRRDSFGVSLLLAFLAAQFATMVLFFVYSRFRIVALPALVPLAALGLEALRARHLVPWILALIGLGLGMFPEGEEARAQRINQHVTLASAFRVRGELDAARQQLALVQHGSEISVRGELERFEIERAQGNPTAAVAVLEEGLERSPDQPLYLMRLARFLATQSQPPRLGEAIALARRAVANAPGLLESHRVLGIALRLQGDGAALANAMALAIRLPGADAEVIALYGAGLRLTGATAEAEAALLRATELDADEVKAWGELLELYTATGRRDAATRARAEIARITSSR